MNFRHSLSNTINQIKETIGEVIESKHPDYKVGDSVTGWGGVQQYIATDGQGFYKVDTSLAPMPVYIGTLGMPGMTAYFGILEVGKIKEGGVFLVRALPPLCITRRRLPGGLPIQYPSAAAFHHFLT